MSSALIGSTGFIGSSLADQMAFDDLCHSTDIETIRGKKYDLVVSAANSGVRWKANQQPAEDLENIKKFIAHIDTITADLFVLISTIDVYKRPVGVYEDSTPDADETNAYGANRLQLEQFVQQKFPSHLIIRLPVVYGMKFRKNVIFDALNNNEVEKIDTTAKLQFYHVANLAKDIETARGANIDLLNMATAPVLVGDLMKEVFGLDLHNPPGKGLEYDMRTRYASQFGKTGEYVSDRAEVIQELKDFVSAYRHET